VLRPYVLDSIRNQNSFILVKRDRFVADSCVEITEQVYWSNTGQTLVKHRSNWFEEAADHQRRVSCSPINYVHLLTPSLGLFRENSPINRVH
jgi:hypothetical protein